MQINIVIAEDEKNIRRSLAEFITELGAPYRLIGHVENGVEALKILEKNTVHILLTDIRMPYMDGLTLIKTLRSTNQETKIIVLSAYQDFNYLHEAMLYNITDYLLKPFKRDELIRTISTAASTIETDMSHYSSLLTNQKKWDLPLIRLESTLFDYIILGDSLNALEHIDAFLVAIRKKSNNDKIIMLPYLIDLVLSLRKQLASIADVLLFIEEDWNDLIIVLTPDSTQEMIDRNVIFFVKKCADVVNTMRTQSSPTIIHRCLELLDKSYMKDIKLYDIANQIGLEMSYLSKLLKKELGVNFSEYLTQLRINKAKELLLHRHLKVMEIATMVGYKNPYYLTRIFKKQTGLTPKEYREQERNSKSLAHDLRTKSFTEENENGPH